MLDHSSKYITPGAATNIILGRRGLKIRPLTSLTGPLVLWSWSIKKKRRWVIEASPERSQTCDCHLDQDRMPMIPLSMSLLAAVRRQSTTFVCTSCRVRTYAAKPTSSPANLPPAETTYSTQFHSAAHSRAYARGFFQMAHLCVRLVPC